MAACMENRAWYDSCDTNDTTSDLNDLNDTVPSCAIVWHEKMR